MSSLTTRCLAGWLAPCVAGRRGIYSEPGEDATRRTRTRYKSPHVIGYTDASVFKGENLEIVGESRLGLLGAGFIDFRVIYPRVFRERYLRDYLSDIEKLDI